MDDKPEQQNQQLPGHEMVSLEDSKPLTAPLAREFGSDIVMGDGGTMSSSSDELARQADVILNVPRQDNMLARQQQQVTSPNKMVSREAILDAENRTESRATTNAN